MSKKRDRSYLAEEFRRNEKSRHYNVLQEDNRFFAILHQMGTSEKTVRVKGVRKAKKTDPLSQKAGCGNYGFANNRFGSDPKFTETIDGTGWKKQRHTVCRPRKEPCRLASSSEIHLAMIDPLVKAERAKISKKAKRKKNRNRRANYCR